MAHLSFGVDGILGKMDVNLGDNVAAGFDFDTFYQALGTPTVGDPSLLLYDSVNILADPSVTASLLCQLRAEPAKIALKSAIGARQNAYYQKYANQAAVIAQMQANYGAAAAAKPALLANLAQLAQQQLTMLQQAYQTDGRTGVVKNTTSQITSDTQSQGTSTTTSEGQATGTTQSSNYSETSIDEYTDNFVDYYNAWTGQFAESVASGYSRTEGFPATTTTGNAATYSRQDSSDQTVTDSAGTISQDQQVINTDYGYRVPSAEAQAAYLRAQISLIDEQFAQFMAGQNLPNLNIVFPNELLAIDAGVKQLQVAYLNTLLLSPIAGTVTGIYKNPGEYVQAGDPVIRVENISPIYLVGTLACGARISVGQQAQVTFNLFGGGQQTLTGSVVAARGHTSENRWDVVISYPNIHPLRAPILPLNYHFDFDDTAVQIS